jgi:hypothetical protein
MPEQAAELRRLWAEAVLLIGPYDPYVGGGFPAGLREAIDNAYRPPCWFGENVPGIDECDGELGPDYREGAHWIKRQQVEHTVAALFFGLPEFTATGLGWELKDIAAWDPRNGVPACEKHHRRFDAQRMPTLIVPRHLVPEHVVEFTNDWGLETALEDRNPKEI